MRSAPTVAYPVGRCVLFGHLLLLLGAMGGAALAGWAWLASGPVLVWGLAGGAGLLALWASMARRAWLRAPQGLLQWDSLAPASGTTPHAGGWRWLPMGGGEEALPPGVEVVADFQRWMLLRWQQPRQAAHWAWVERQRAPALWRDLRRALMASALR